MSEDLKNKVCIPCQGGVPPLTADEVDQYLPRISEDWSINEKKTKISLSLKFKDFATPMKMAFEIGKMADEQWHHPELEIGFGHLDIHVWTHKIDGLVESDFIFAAKVDEIIKKFPVE